MRERDIERYLGKRVKTLGGISIKLMPTYSGLPDRLLVLPGGVLRFVELKRLDGRISGVQRLMHERLERLGASVAVLWSREDVDKYLDLESGGSTP